MEHKRGHEKVALTLDEATKVGRVALQEGICPDDAASELVQAAMARRMRKRTGKAPAKVYRIKGG